MAARNIILEDTNCVATDATLNVCTGDSNLIKCCSDCCIDGYCKDAIECYKTQWWFIIIFYILLPLLCLVCVVGCVVCCVRRARLSREDSETKAMQ